MDKFLMDYDFFKNSSTKVYDYTSLDFNEVIKYLNSLDKSWFEYVKIYEGTTIEKACYDYYNTTDYYDLLLLLNGREMLNDTPYTSDVLIDNTENELKEYEFRVFNDDFESIVNTTRNRLKDKIENDLNEKNFSLLYIKIIKKNYINEVKKNINDILNTQKDLFSLLDN